MERDSWHSVGHAGWITPSSVGPVGIPMAGTATSLGGMIGVASPLRSAVIGPRDDSHESMAFVIPPQVCPHACVRPIDAAALSPFEVVVIAGCAFVTFTGGALAKTRSLMRVRAADTTGAHTGAQDDETA